MDLIVCSLKLDGKNHNTDTLTQTPWKVVE